MPTTSAKYSIDLAVEIQNLARDLKQTQALFASSAGAIAKDAQASSTANNAAILSSTNALSRAQIAANERTQEAITKNTNKETFKRLQAAQQVQDFTIQVAGGQNPLLAAVQQGSQLSFLAGGVTKIPQLLLGVLTPLNLALGAAAAGVGALAFAYNELSERADSFNKSGILTGNVLGTNQAKFEAMVTSIDKLNRASGSGTREVASALAGTGYFDASGIERASFALKVYADASGKSAADVAKAYVEMAKSPTQFVESNNRSLYLLTAAEFERVRILELSGKKTEAAFIVQEAFIRKFNQDTAAELEKTKGYVDKTIDAFKSLWAGIVGLGAPETLEQQLKKTQDILNKYGANDGKGGGFEKFTESFRQQKEDILESQRLLARGETVKQVSPLKENEAIDAAKKARELAPSYAALENARKLAAIDDEILKISITTGSVKKDLENTTDVQQKLALQSLVYDAERLTILQEIKKLEQQKAGIFVAQGDVAGGIKAQEQRIGINTKINELRAKSDALPTLPDLQTANEIKVRAEADKDIKAKRADALKTLEGLELKYADETKRIRIGEIKDVSERERSILQINVDARQREVALLYASTEEKIAALDELKQWQIAEEARIETAEKKRLDAATGATEGLRKYTAELAERGKAAEASVTKVLGTIEDSILSLATTGQLNIKSLVDSMIAEFLRLQVIKPIMADIFGSGSAAGGALTSLFGGSGGGGGGTTVDEFGGVVASDSGFFDDFLGSIGFRAKGGDVMAGSPYIVGEKGSELFIPNTSGTVVSNSDLANMGGSSPTINISIDSRTDRAEVAVLVQRAVQQGLAQDKDYRARNIA